MRPAILSTLAAALLLAGGGAATVLIVPAVPETLVEGHTVFVAIDTIRIGTREERFAAAVAVLVTERVRNEFAQRFPGVLWFNDQYLIDPQEPRRSTTQDRTPCTGAVIAVNHGDEWAVDQDLGGRYTLIDPVYNESYLITDPNDRTWFVDEWFTAAGPRAWTIALHNDQINSAKPDDGKCNKGAYGGGFGGGSVRYNALLYFRLDHLTVPDEPKNHTVGGDDRVFDAAACHPSPTNRWPCPGGDDDAEGNSHRASPAYPVPRAGRGNHGGSADCDGVVRGCHATRNILIFYGYVTPPVLRNYFLIDAEGRFAPYHCHDDPLCLPEDAENTVFVEPPP